MGRWMKVLVSVACLCVIGVSAHYTYVQYEAYLAGESEAARQKAKLLRATKEKEAKLAEERRARSEAWAKKKRDREEARMEIERQKQADRDNAASALKDAVVNY